MQQVDMVQYVDNSNAMRYHEQRDNLKIDLERIKKDLANANSTIARLEKGKLAIVDRFRPATDKDIENGFDSVENKVNMLSRSLAKPTHLSWQRRSVERFGCLTCPDRKRRSFRVARNKLVLTDSSEVLSTSLTARSFIP